MEEVYEVGGELGKGAFSVVRYGRHRQTGQQVSDNIMLSILPLD